ncbi:hypothetical protein [Spirulina sp. 06S082]|uniref:hypothetical protein n=1 Tax=Spirulina sp. 06S082 TaxID=3110248 RepID=UPI002B2092D4|nr:hypothetical protein [Spirulina sp. 06S082]MEA5469798.1 hypothetical protein [Spirulina sp. 06S082]
MNNNQSESRRASTEAFEQSLDALGDLLQPLEEDEEIPIPSQPDAKPNDFDAIGVDLKALLSEENQE